MTLTDLSASFNTSLAGAFAWRKSLFLFLVLLFCGLLTTLCKGFAAVSGPWASLILTFFPLFVSTALLLGAQVVMMRAYRQPDARIRHLFSTSWERLLCASYLALPLLLAYVIVWMFLGIFMLIRGVPYVGSVASLILAFVPFLLFVASLVLLVVTFLLFFVVVPLIEAEGIVEMKRLPAALWEPIRRDVFTYLLGAVVSLVPLLIVWGILSAASGMTRQLVLGGASPFEHVVAQMFILIPFAALLTPAVTFFFNFAAEVRDHR